MEATKVLRAGELIHQARKEAGIEIVTLANLLLGNGYTGMLPPMSLIGKAEKGLAFPSPALIEAITRCLPITALELYEEIGRDSVRVKRDRARKHGIQLTPLPWDNAA